MQRQTPVYNLISMANRREKVDIYQISCDIRLLTTRPTLIARLILLKIVD